MILRASAVREVRLEARLDTGADYCIFQREYAEALDLQVESGILQMFSTATGTFQAFGHEITLVAMGVELSGICYFFGNHEIRKNVLGRIGWLSKVRIGIDDTGDPGVLYASFAGLVTE